MNMRCARSREVALVGIVRSLAVMNMVDELGDEEIEVGVALAVRMARQVDRHAVDVHGEVSPVIKIEAAQEVLVRFAAAAVLRDDHARDGFQDVRGTHDRSAFDAFRVDVAFAGRVRARQSGGRDQDRVHFR